MKYVRKIRNVLFGFSVLLMALGLFLIVEPSFSVVIICYIFGGIIMACGVIDIINFFVNKNQRELFRFDLVKGVTMMALGLFVVIRPGFVSLILPTVFGLVLLVNGLATALSAFDIRSGGQITWIPILILGFITAALGVITVLNPFKVNSTAMVVIGASLLCDGISNIWCNACLKKHVKDNFPENQDSSEQQ